MISVVKSIGLFSLALLIALGMAAVMTIPVWWIWNNIIAVKFALSTFSMWEAFLSIVMVRLILPTSSTNVSKG